MVSRLYTIDLLLPWRMPWPVWMGSATLLAALLIVGLSLLRRTLRSPYELWQATHGVLAMVLMATAVAHILAVGRFSAIPAMRALWAVYLVAFIGMFLRYRLVRPLQLWRRPWEVVDNRSEARRRADRHPAAGGPSRVHVPSRASSGGSGSDAPPSR